MFALFVQGSYVFTWPTIPFTDIGGGPIFGTGWQSSVGFALVAALLFGVLLGLINGVIVSYFGVTAFIATLGVAGIVEGYLIRITGGRSVQLPENVTSKAQGTLLGWSGTIELGVVVHGVRPRVRHQPRRTEPAVHRGRSGGGARGTVDVPESHRSGPTDGCRRRQPGGIAVWRASTFVATA